MRIVQIIPAPPGGAAKYLSAEGESTAKLVGYALIERADGRRFIRPVIDWGQPFGIPDILGRDGNVLIEDEI